MKLSAISFLVLFSLMLTPIAVSIEWIDVPHEAVALFQDPGKIWVLTASDGAHLVDRFD